MEARAMEQDESGAGAEPVQVQEQGGGWPAPDAAMMEHALAALRWGWWVQPLKWKQPTALAATSSPAAVSDLWDIAPELNIGVDLVRSNLVVVDCHGTAEEVPELLAKAGLDLPPTLTVRTGRGRHFYFVAPMHMYPQLRVISPRITLLALGYVVGPGSRHPLGCRYEVTDSRPPAELPSCVAVLLASSDLAEDGPERETETPLVPPVRLLSASDAEAMAVAAVRITQAPPGQRMEMVNAEMYRLAVGGARLAELEKLAIPLVDNWSEPRPQLLDLLNVVRSAHAAGSSVAARRHLMDGSRTAELERKVTELEAELGAARAAAVREERTRVDELARDIFVALVVRRREAGEYVTPENTANVARELAAAFMRSGI